MGKKVSFVIIGFGFIGKKHAELIQCNLDSELIAVIEPDVSKHTLANIPFFTNFEDFLKSDLKCDFVCVCTPNYLHIEHTKLALSNGFHAICEKPLGLRVEECNSLIEAENESNRKVFCVLQNRYSPPIQWLKKVIEDQILGDIYHIQINCYWNRDDRYYFPNNKKHDWKGTKSKDGGVLFTQFSHFVDILTWCFGEVFQLNHVSNNFTHQGKTDFEDTGSILFKTSANAIGNFNYSTAVWDKNLESTFVIIGEKGSLKIGGQYMDEVVHCHIQDYTMPKLEASMPPNDYGHYKGSAQNHCFVIQNAIDFILKAAKIDVDLNEGILSVKNIVNLSKTH